MTARRRSPRLLVGLLVATLGGLGPAAVAAGAWSATASGRAAGAATTMPNGNTPSVRGAGSTVTVLWSAATMADGAAVSGYVVARYNALNGTAATVGPGCSGVITTTSCTETGVPAGSWIYTDMPVQASWTGGPSVPSSTVVLP